jgi:hypothetical protein
MMKPPLLLGGSQLLTGLLMTIRKIRRECRIELVFEGFRLGDLRCGEKLECADNEENGVLIAVLLYVLQIIREPKEMFLLKVVLRKATLCRLTRKEPIGLFPMKGCIWIHCHLIKLLFTRIMGVRCNQTLIGNQNRFKSFIEKWSLFEAAFL